MLFGIQSSQDVKLSNIGRALGEAIPLIRTEKRLARNLKHTELEAEVTTQLVEMASARIQQDTVLALDLSDPPQRTKSMPKKWSTWRRCGMAVRARRIPATGWWT